MREHFDEDAATAADYGSIAVVIVAVEVVAVAFLARFFASIAFVAVSL